MAISLRPNGEAFHPTAFSIPSPHFLFPQQIPLNSLPSPMSSSIPSPAIFPPISSLSNQFFESIIHSNSSLSPSPSHPNPSSLLPLTPPLPYLRQGRAEAPPPHRTGAMHHGNHTLHNNRYSGGWQGSLLLAAFGTGVPGCFLHGLRNFHARDSEPL